jgi:hypothetical protein
MTMLATAILEKDLEAIASKVVDAALAGDIQTARFIIERIVPAQRERPINIDLPEVTTLDGVSIAQATILTAVSTGVLLLAEGTALAGILEQRRQALEAVQLEQRITALEKKSK